MSVFACVCVCVCVCVCACFFFKYSLFVLQFPVPVHAPAHVFFFLIYLFCFYLRCSGQVLNFFCLLVVFFPSPKLDLKRLSKMETFIQSLPLPSPQVPSLPPKNPSETPSKKPRKRERARDSEPNRLQVVVCVYLCESFRIALCGK